MSVYGVASTRKWYSVSGVEGAGLDLAWPDLAGKQASILGYIDVENPIPYHNHLRPISRHVTSGPSRCIHHQQ
jgi:hypothetical protein